MKLSIFMALAAFGVFAAVENGHAQSTGHLTIELARIHYPSWYLKGVSLNNSKVSGVCDLTPARDVFRSNLMTQTVFVHELSVPEFGHYKGCFLDVKGAKLESGAIFSTLYLPSESGGQIKLEVKVGIHFEALSQGVSNILTESGYVDLHRTQSGILKFKPYVNTEVSGTCAAPQKSGFLGLGKATVTCKLDNNEGTVTLVQE